MEFLRGYTAHVVTPDDEHYDVTVTAWDFEGALSRVKNLHQITDFEYDVADCDIIAMWSKGKNVTVTRGSDEKKRNLLQKIVGKLFNI